MTLGVRIQAESSDLWALRCDDPDKTIAGRSWTTEVTIGRSHDNAPRLSLRLLASTAEGELNVEPHVPGLLQQVASRCGLLVGGYRTEANAWHVGSEDELAQLIAMLEDHNRQLPVVVATGDERTANPDQTTIDVDKLARATIGLAHVVTLPASATYALSDSFGKKRSVFNGAVRVYMPGFDAASDRYDHPLILAETIDRDLAACVRNLCNLAAVESLRRTRLGYDVLSFATVRSEALRNEQQVRIDEGASDAEQLATAQQRIAALEMELLASQSQADQSFDLAHQEEERAKIAEAQLFSARSRIQQLDDQRRSHWQQPDAEMVVPESWDEFADWCDQTLVGRLVLVPAARRGAKKPAFADVALVGRCVLWLVDVCRDRRMKGGGSLSNVAIEQGVENAPCGEDAFEFDFMGQPLKADWHVKSGGNTRDPERCLRIYYAWDANAQQIVVAHMPAHRRTGAS